MSGLREYSRGGLCAGQFAELKEMIFCQNLHARTICACGTGSFGRIRRV